MPEPGHLRIGELSRRTDLSVDLLRAWEKRYGLLDPDRSDGGYRLYSDNDVERVRAMQVASRARGSRLPKRRAARSRPRSRRRSVASLSRGRGTNWRDALEHFAEGRANAVLDQLLAPLSIDAVLRDVVLPYLHDLGERLARGEMTVAQEHFASNVLRGRPLGLGRGWGEGSGPHALLAARRGNSTTSG